jgi:predicted negative regulator of RcsB-dependent stress response
VTLPFRALFADLRGDVLLAQGKADAARAAYQDALDGSPPENPYRALVEVKRDALPGGKP